MNILFDYQIFTLQKYGGISRCFVELYKNLPLEIKAEFGVRESDNVYLQEVKRVHPANYKYNHFQLAKLELDIISFRELSALVEGLFDPIKNIYYSVRARLGLRTRLISIIQRVKNK